MRWPAPALLLALLATACRAPAPLGPSAGTPAEVSVELLPGLAELEARPAPAREHVEVLLDITPAGRVSSDGVPPWAAARSAAARFVNSMPDDTSLHVHVLGRTPGRGCEPATQLDRDQRTRSHAELAAQISSLSPAGEGSLPVALAELRGAIAPDERTRVVVFSNLGHECGGDLCTAAELLIDAGVQLDFVVLGDGEAPACLSALTQTARWAAHAEVITAPAYRVFAYDPNGGPDPHVLALGVADSSRRAVPAGAVMIELDFERPMRIGPVVLLPGTWTHFRVIEFPTLQPPVREWSWKTLPTAAGARSTR